VSSAGGRLFCLLFSPFLLTARLLFSPSLRAVAFLKDKDMWNAVHVLTRCLFPALRVLRLADKSDPGFDCLYYFIRRTDKAIEWSTRSFESVEYFSMAVNDPATLTDLFHNSSQQEHADDDEYQNMLEQGHESDSDGEGGSDEESTNGLPFASTGGELGCGIHDLWNRRKEQMVSDFCIAGWLLSPLDEVMEDVKVSRCGASNEAMDRMLSKLYHNLKEDELGCIKDTFWTEYDEFSNRTGRFGDGRKYIWNSAMLRERKSAQWHATFSVVYTKVSLVGRFVISFLHLLTLAPCRLLCRYLVRSRVEFFRHHSVLE
jgi:hypothetical protein